MFNWIKRLLGFKPKNKTQWVPQWTQFLANNVAFYRVLSHSDQRIFEQRALLFLETTSIESGSLTVTNEDCLLVAASAIIPVWGFPNWHYFNLRSVYLLPGAFNLNFDVAQADSTITGMVGTGKMSNKLVLSQPALHLGFKNTKDKQNVGIHEFVHLIDMADGNCDGYPERLHEYSFALPWFEFVKQKITDIENKKSNIRAYGATNNAEFLSVASEYFFERPAMLKTKHPELFEALTRFYQQDVMHIEKDISIRKKSLCPCGSKKRYKRCCMPAA